MREGRSDPFPLKWSLKRSVFEYENWFGQLYMHAIETGFRPELRGLWKEMNTMVNRSFMPWKQLATNEGKLDMAIEIKRLDTQYWKRAR